MYINLIRHVLFSVCVCMSVRFRRDVYSHLSLVFAPNQRVHDTVNMAASSSRGFSLEVSFSERGAIEMHARAVCLAQPSGAAMVDNRTLHLFSLASLHAFAPQAQMVTQGTYTLRHKFHPESKQFNPHLQVRPVELFVSH